MFWPISATPVSFIGIHMGRVSSLKLNKRGKIFEAVNVDWPKCLHGRETFIFFLTATVVVVVCACM